MIDDRFTLRPIRTDADYQAALKRVEPCFDTDPEPDSDERAHFEALIALVMAYEAKHFLVLPPGPIEAIKFSMDQQGLTNRDLEPMIGSRGRVLEVLSGKRRLSMAMVWRLHKGLGIAAETLIRPPRST